MLSPGLLYSVMLEQPLDLIKLSLDSHVLVKMKAGRQMKGLLHAFDAHMNLILENVEEQVVNQEGIVSSERKYPILFIRGDSVILVSPINI